MQRLQPAAEAAESSIKRRMIHHPDKGLERDLFEKRRSLSDGVAAVVQQMMMQIDLHRAGLAAGAAEGRGVGEMFPIPQTAQVRRDDRADGTGVSRAVTVAAHVAVDGTDVQTSAAADAMKGVALLGVRQQAGASIVE